MVKQVVRDRVRACAGVSAQGAKTSTLRRPRAFSLGDCFTTAWACPHGYYDDCSTIDDWLGPREVPV